MIEYVMFRTLQEIETFVDEALEICQGFKPYRQEYHHILEVSEETNLDTFERDLHILKRKIDIINQQLYHEDEVNVEEKISDTIEKYEIYCEQFDKVRSIILRFKGKAKIKNDTD